MHLEIEGIESFETDIDDSPDASHLIVSVKFPILAMTLTLFGVPATARATDE